MNHHQANSNTENNYTKGNIMKKAEKNNSKTDGRCTPTDHPNPAAESLQSSRETGLRMIGVVERSGVLPHIEARFARKRGRKQMVSYKAILVAILIAMYSHGRSYTRADVCAALPGLKPSVARKLGVLDDNGKWNVPTYKSLNWMIKRLERRLRSGWISGDTVCDLDWYAASMLRASVPRRVRRSVKTIAIDSTAVESWACSKEFTKQQALEKDAYANYRKASLENPDLPEPELKRQLLAEEARRQGLQVGRDGRIIRGADEDARAGWRTATNSHPGGYFVGYELTAAVATQTVEWNGRNGGKFKLGPRVPRYILAISMNPAGNNPGPIGTETARKARSIAPKVHRVVADRGFTLKRESFLRELHRDKIDVVMDYKKAVVDKAEPTPIGQRREPIFMHCGTILPRWIPKYWRRPPTDLRGDEEALTNWYNRRAALYRFSFKGWLNNGGMKLQCPQCAGRVPSQQATAASGSYSKPYAGAPPAGQCCGGMVNADPVEVDQFQKLPYGTEVWHAAYGKARAVVEGLFGDLKKKKGLSRGTCEALGLAANTMAAMAAAVAYNIRKAVSQDDDEYDDTTDGGEHDGTGNGDGEADMSPATDDNTEETSSGSGGGKAPDRAPPS